MSAGTLKAWLEGERDRLVWIEFDDYAHHVFAGDAADWLSAANTFVSGVAQAQGVVGTEVLSIDLLAPYFAALESDTDAPADAVQTMLQLDGPRNFIEEVIDALAHRFADRVDLVVKLSSPAAVLARAGMRGEASFDDLDDVGIALSNLLRAFSAKSLAGLVIRCPDPLTPDDAEALESVVSAARHYEWRVVLSLDDCSAVPEGAPEMDADLLLLPNVESGELVASSSPLPLGGALGRDYWLNGAEKPAAGRFLLYGAIPADTEPELVVQRVADASA